MTRPKRFRFLPTAYGAFRDDIRSYFIDNVLPNVRSVLDPMAGNATLLPHCEAFGIKSHFNDLLPVHYYVNQAKTWAAYCTFKEREAGEPNYLMKASLACMKKLAKRSLVISSQWIHDDVLSDLLEAWTRVDDYPHPVQPLLRAIIILCVRPYSCATPSRNPTWLKPGGMSQLRGLRDVVCSKIEILRSFFAYYYGEPRLAGGGRCSFSCKDAEVLRSRARFDAIITSPPYCNRLDPVHLYGPELSFLSAVGHSLEVSRLIGTTRVRDYRNPEEDVRYIASVAPETQEFLDHAKDKSRGGEANYYYRYYVRFYAHLYRVLENASRLLTRRGVFYVVVQNNAHRGQLNCMGDYVGALFRTLGWESRIAEEHARRHMGMRNVSRRDPLVAPKQSEYVIEARPCA